MGFFDKLFRQRVPHVEKNEGTEESKVGSSTGPGDEWPKLIQALASDDFYVRMAAVERLGKIGGTRSIDLLISCLKDKDDGIRSAAVKSLAEIGDVRAIRPLRAALEDAHRRIDQLQAEMKVTDDAEHRDLTMILINELRTRYIPSIENTVRGLGK